MIVVVVVAFSQTQAAAATEGRLSSVRRNKQENNDKRKALPFWCGGAPLAEDHQRGRSKKSKTPFDTISTDL